MTAHASQLSVPIPGQTASAKPKPRAARHKPAAQPAFNLNLILLDPAHGGADPGGQIAPDLPEKTVTLAFAQRLRPLLAAQGFTVVLTRDADLPPARPAPPPDPDDPDAQPAPPVQPPQLTPDQRAELANRLHPVACLILHATSSGSGVHLFTSALTVPPNPDPHAIQLWDTAQAAELSQSQNLSATLAQSVTALRIPIVTSPVSIRPIDSLTCPAVALELAPSSPNGDTITPPSNPAYQQRVAESLVAALVAWRTQAETVLQQQAAEAERAAAQPAPAQKPAEKKPAPKPIPTITPGHLIPGTIPPLPRIPQIVAPKPSAKPAPQPGVPR
jgi:N-acetylmuramoyl-L-alanine amidase